MSRARRRLPAGPLGAVLLLLLPLLVLESVRSGTTGTHDLATTWRGCLRRRMRTAAAGCRRAS